MNIFRVTTIALPVMLLMACGGGGSSGGGAGFTPDLINLRPTTENSPSIQSIQRIATREGATISLSNVLQAEGLESSDTALCSVNACLIRLPGSIRSLGLGTDTTILSFVDVSLLNPDHNYFSESANLEITNGRTIGGIDFTRGRATATRADDSSPVEFETFAGWLDGSIFGTTQITVGESGSEEYRFISYAVGVPSGSNPSGSGSATWEGATVATIKTDRTFIRGDATITIDDLASPVVDLMFDNWYMLPNMDSMVEGDEITGMAAITYEDLMLTSGAFESSGNGNQAEGRFFGTNHNEVGGFFNTPDVTGAFGGTRQ